MNEPFCPLSKLIDFERGRAYQNEINIPKLRHLKKALYALQLIASIKDRIPFNAAAAATECIRLAKEGLQEECPR